MSAGMHCPVYTVVVVHGVMVPGVVGGTGTVRTVVGTRVHRPGGATPHCNGVFPTVAGHTPL